MPPSQRSTYGPTRRQNKNCDQCRQGKRRCDVQVHTQSGPVPTPYAGCNRPSLPCTNCIRWRKRCTVGWITSREQRKSRIIDEASLQSSKKPPTEVGALSPSDDTITPSWRDDEANAEFDGYLAGLLSTEPSFESESYGSIGPESLPTIDSTGPCAIFNEGAHVLDLVGSSLDAGPFITAVNGDVDESRRDTRSSHAEYLRIGQAGLFGVPGGQNETGTGVPVRPRFATNHFGLDAGARSSQEETPADPWQQDWPCSSRSYRSIAVNRAASPFTSQLLSEEHNRLSIKKGLMKIYHDSMEVFDGRAVWSSDWANRIVTRVCDMDKAYSMTGALTTREQHQASTVLNSVVMAFASQWSQTSHGHDTCAPVSPVTSSSWQSSAAGSHGTIGLGGPDGDMFGRNMQQTLWHQASRALCEASENTSFRVILAGIIFSLTQRPIDPEVFQSPCSSRPNDLEPLYTVLNHDGPPIVLDIALRKLQDHQRSLEDAKIASAEGTRTSSAWAQLLGAHEQTFGLLYWLAVMFDTLSAAVNGRPVTISDTNSNGICTEANIEASVPLHGLGVDLDGWSDLSSTTLPSSTTGVDVWGEYFLQPRSRAGDVRKQRIRWPCSYNDAASCLADAAPVKVLLFRRVAQLQALFYNRSSATQVEAGIAAAIEVYDHWNTTYGRFIEDCIRNHEDLPARIQSWYILLAGHWNLAVLILSDLIEKLDDSQRTMASHRCSRQLTDFAETRRARSAFAVSELGRCSRSGNEDLSFSQSPDFHHAVNKAALLTEPWTMVLVRSFGYAGAVWARQVALESSPRVCGATSWTTVSRERLQYCIDALWLLGKKSDMAMCAARVLQQAAGTRRPTEPDITLG